MSGSAGKRAYDFAWLEEITEVAKNKEKPGWLRNKKQKKRKKRKMKDGWVRPVKVKPSTEMMESR